MSTVVLLGPLPALNLALFCSLASQDLSTVPALASCCCGKAQPACTYPGSYMTSGYGCSAQPGSPPNLACMHAKGCCSPAQPGLRSAPVLTLSSRSSDPAGEPLQLPIAALTSIHPQTPISEQSADYPPHAQSSGSVPCEPGTLPAYPRPTQA